MKKILRIIIIIMVVFLGNIISAQNVMAAPDKSKNFRIEKDINMEGVFGSNVFFFNIDRDWKVDNIYLNLIFTESELLDKTQSSLTVYINNSPVYSMKVGDKKKYKENIKINIPKDKLIHGYNEVKIKIYSRISEKPCTDDVNSGNWFIIHKGSYVHVDFKDREDTKTLIDFPFPYLKDSDEDPANSMIIVSDDFSKEQITSAMMLCSNFGSKRKSDNVNVKVYKISEANLKNKLDIIFIGNKSNTPKEFLSLLSKEEIDRIDKDAIIKEVTSPYNSNKKLLLLISNNEKNIIKASKLLCSKDYMKQVDKDTIIINDSMDVEDIKEEKWNKVVLSDLGYDNVILKGPFKQEATFNLNIPKDRFIKEGSKIVINNRYSKNIDFDRSLITVYINDTPVSSKKLNSKYADNDSFEISIPKDIRNTSNYEIKVVFNLEIKDLFCTFREEENPWAYILNSSYIYTPYKEGRNAVFENYPNPFISNGGINNLTLVLSDNITSKELNFAGNIMANIGHDLNNNNGELSVVSAKDLSSKLKKNNLIFIGTPSTNSAIKNLNNNLHIKFNKNFSGFLSNEKMKFFQDYSGELASIQLIESPYNKDNNAMIVTSTYTKDLVLAQKYLSDISLVKSLKGNGITIDRDGTINYSYFGNEYDKEKEEDSNINKFKNISLDSNIKNLLIFFIFIMLILVAGSILFIRKYKRKN
ncbi:cellulose biosynthesis cyclic di-GMP-binding regulatory protein BcsB [Clostridium sporogenes]|uniref:cellulose biosynthesis cyclic di-GMP-binding regulatory protein BcsB n=1 Tax=Clostridium sp. LCP25S3_F8 TaxID=3438751 RepID=UPI0013D6460E|nr:cellulose biosynthesis cyclic di-GMP-binding regulatory protein BcsB [Clostridium sporogenes]NFS26742.1 cellulose biosynthesis cyclic di-GMP-binding regulatory protein BcsB [Clostridium sporogenes]